MKPRIQQNATHVVNGSALGVIGFDSEMVTIILFVEGDGLVLPALAASLEDGGPPGLLLAEALDLFGPMVLSAQIQ